MTEISKVPFNRSYWVVPGKLLAGCYPGSEDSIEEERKFKGLMGNHILVKTLPEYKFADQDIKNRCVGFYGDDRVFTDEMIPSLRAKLSSLSEFVREI
jgi:hypothetical protein